MPGKKNFKLKTEEIRQLIESMGGCIATDRITVDGLPVGYMYREEPDSEIDSGWRFFAGDEDQEYADNHKNSCKYNVNTIANYDPAIIPYLGYPIGVTLEREENSDNFIVVPE
ncbi:MAG: DUF2185 domain-containing protein [Taibaiella sp.]|nr:DUF2185 domain-containing protein [Taibaiella sp.]